MTCVPPFRKLSPLRLNLIMWYTKGSVVPLLCFSPTWCVPALLGESLKNIGTLIFPRHLSFLRAYLRTSIPTFAKLALLHETLLLLWFTRPTLTTLPFVPNLESLPPTSLKLTLPGALRHLCKLLLLDLPHIPRCLLLPSTGTWRGQPLLASIQ